jgi:hypothetical protein
MVRCAERIDRRDAFWELEKRFTQRTVFLGLPCFTHLTAVASDAAKGVRRGDEDF